MLLRCTLLRQAALVAGAPAQPAVKQHLTTPPLAPPSGPPLAGGQGQNRNLGSRLAQLDDQVSRQQELLYSVDFQLQEMERKVARARGVRSDEETRQLNARIQQLTGVLEGVNGEHLMLLEQVGV